MEQFYCNWSESVFSEGCDSEFTVKCGYCGRILIGGEGYYQKDGKPYCEDCLEGASLADLVRISETEVETLLSSIGLRHAYLELGW